MFCPNCGSEYRVGYKICSDCSITLVDEIQEKKRPYSGKYCTKIAKVIISTFWKISLGIMKSKTYLRISSSSYKVYILSLFIFNFLTIRYISLWVVVPDWEIPAGLVEPLNYIGRCAVINFLLCMISFLIGYRWFRVQRLISKIISFFWLVGSMGFAFIASDFIKLPKLYVNLITHYWLVGMLLPFLLLSLLMYNDYIISSNKSDIN